MAHNDRRKIHEPCGREVAHTLDGRPYTHKCVSAAPGPEGFEDPAPKGTTTFPVSAAAPTVEGMDDTLEDPTAPFPGTAEKGPWFGAMYPGRCDVNECRIEEGDRIRADGQGGYECEDCGSFDDTMDRHVRVSLGLAEDSAQGTPADTDWQALASAAAKRHTSQAADPAPADPDPFEDPTAPEDRPVKLNVSGQPKARRDYLKRYIVIDPDLGDFRRTKGEGKPYGISRATTFNKHAQNTIALNAWSKRNVVMGASMRPDILRKAHGLTHDTAREALDRIADELETAAGAKVASDEGTFLHEFCDQVDAGLKTWEDAPAAYQQDIRRYVQALADAGLEPVPGLIERTTFIREYGGVAGTFDRCLFHRPSGTYLIGDLKTGQTMKYAMDETECQIWTYAHGINQTGIYDWNTDTWTRQYGPAPGGWLPPVREDVGVIIHMPVQGKEAGEVYLRLANLERGKAYADLNYAVKSYEKSKVLPFAIPGAPETAAEAPVETPANPTPAGTWEHMFAAVQSAEEAATLWTRAVDARVRQDELDALVAIAQKALADKG